MPTKLQHYAQPRRVATTIFNGRSGLMTATRGFQAATRNSVGDYSLMTCEPFASPLITAAVIGKPKPRLIATVEVTSPSTIRVHVLSLRGHRHDARVEITMFDTASPERP